ncbi:hypothetical protein RND81_03G080500 [Saponaria officinalis]|uniref:C2 domain-containing protein n=1 Tax=Saponaria officinalis TaxID=3572 RepID=A0AAW1M5R7_SAPOF
MESTSQELSLNCILSTHDHLKKTYIMVTLFHGCSSKYEKRQADLDAKGNAKFQFKDVNVKTAYLQFQVFTHRWLLSDKHVGDVNVLVSDLMSSQILTEQPLFASYELGKTSKKGKDCYLKLMCRLSSREKDSTAVVSRDEKRKVVSKHDAAGIGNDIALFKTVPSFRTPLVSLIWN